MKKNRPSFNKELGSFTLIEVLVVLIIIGILNLNISME
jgi:type II secretory pathway pseudopilin PulG